MKKFKPSDKAKKLKYAIRDVALMASEIERKEKTKVIRLNIGDPTYYDFDVPEHIKQAFCEAVKNGKNFYSPSDGIRELKEAIIEDVEKTSGIKVNLPDVLITNGLSEAIMGIFSAAFSPGEKVLVPSPTYPPYISAAKFFDIEPIEYVTLEDEGWIPDIDDVRKKAEMGAKAIVIINPNNPTGAVYPERIVRELIDIAGEYDLFVISDEIYDKIVFEEPKPISAAKIAKDVPIIMLNGFSKAYLATGWRVGYMVKVDSEGALDEVWNAILKYLLIRISGVTPAQYAVVQALKGPQDFLDDYISELKKRRDYAFERISEISGLSVRKPKGALYIFPRIEDKRYQDDLKFVKDLLYKYKVLVVHGSGFGLMGRNHFRAVFLPPIEVQREAYDRIEKMLEK
ncbi:MAG: aminotransferase class I/II-fold pyridoxal phosphate-dependent enzyme [Candidatus Njordarchaeia archaeon]